jgi:hypothetical protein
MAEHPYRRYTKEKSWAALYCQYIDGCFAIVPHSATTNSIAVIYCKDAAGNGSPQRAQEKMSELVQRAEEVRKFFADKLDAEMKREQEVKRRSRSLVALTRREIPVPFVMKDYREAVVLARSSEYHKYSLQANIEIQMVICGLHDSYLNVPVWELQSNKVFLARTPAMVISSEEFRVQRASLVGHNILVGALVCGDKTAEAFLNTLPDRTRTRIARTVFDLQNEHYRGRPLPFLTGNESTAINQKIRESMVRYHANKQRK